MLLPLLPRGSMKLFRKFYIPDFNKIDWGDDKEREDAVRLKAEALRGIIGDKDIAFQLGTTTKAVAAWYDTYMPSTKRWNNFVLRMRMNLGAFFINTGFKFWPHRPVRMYYRTSNYQSESRALQQPYAAKSGVILETSAKRYRFR